MLQDRFLVTCSELPRPQLTVTKVSEDKNAVKVIARGKSSLTEDSACGYTCLAQNPLVREHFASSSQIIDDAEQGIAMWDLTKLDVSTGEKSTSGSASEPQKRKRTDIVQFEPTGFLKCTTGVQSMVWASDATLIAGCCDH